VLQSLKIWSLGYLLPERIGPDIHSFVVNKINVGSCEPANVQILILICVVQAFLQRVCFKWPFQVLSMHAQPSLTHQLALHPNAPYFTILICLTLNVVTCSSNETIHVDTIQYNTIQYNTIQYNTIKFIYPRWNLQYRYIQV
jgi:branched-subunit amino acid transport protein AzlD